MDCIMKNFILGSQYYTINLKQGRDVKITALKSYYRAFQSFPATAQGDAAFDN